MISRQYQTRIYEGGANELYVETDAVPARQVREIKFIAVSCDIADPSKTYQLFAVNPAGIKQAITNPITGDFGDVSVYNQLAGLTNGSDLILGEGWKLRAERSASAANSKLRIIMTFKDEFEKWPSMFEPHLEKRKQRYGRMIPSILEKVSQVVGGGGYSEGGGGGGEGESLP